MAYATMASEQPSIEELRSHLINEQNKIDFDIQSLIMDRIKVGNSLKNLPGVVTLVERN